MGMAEQQPASPLYQALPVKFKLEDVSEKQNKLETPRSNDLHLRGRSLDSMPRKSSLPKAAIGENQQPGKPEWVPATEAVGRDLASELV